MIIYAAPVRGANSDKIRLENRMNIKPRQYTDDDHITLNTSRPFRSVIAEHIKSAQIRHNSMPCLIKPKIAVEFHVNIQCVCLVVISIVDTMSIGDCFSESLTYYDVYVTL